MTLLKLKKIIDQMVENGHSRSKVTIDKETFQHPLEGDGCCILDVHSYEIVRVLVADDFGGVVENKDGSERTNKCFVLRGSDANS